MTLFDAPSTRPMLGPALGCSASRCYNWGTFDQRRLDASTLDGATRCSPATSARASRPLVDALTTLAAASPPHPYNQRRRGRHQRARPALVRARLLQVRANEETGALGRLRCAAAEHLLGDPRRVRQRRLRPTIDHDRPGVPCRAKTTASPNGSSWSPTRELSHRQTTSPASVATLPSCEAAARGVGAQIFDHFPEYGPRLRRLPGHPERAGPRPVPPDRLDEGRRQPQRLRAQPHARTVRHDRAHQATSSATSTTSPRHTKPCCGPAHQLEFARCRSSPTSTPTTTAWPHHRLDCSARAALPYYFASKRRRSLLHGLSRTRSSDPRGRRRHRAAQPAPSGCRRTSRYCTSTSRGRGGERIATLEAEIDATSAADWPQRKLRLRPTTTSSLQSVRPHPSLEPGTVRCQPRRDRRRSSSPIRPALAVSRQSAASNSVKIDDGRRRDHESQHRAEEPRGAPLESAVSKPRASERS